MILQIIYVLLVFWIIFAKLLKSTYFVPKQLSDVSKLIIPGPFCLPLIGYLPIFTSGQPPQVLYKKLAEKYGEIFQVKVGTRPEFYPIDKRGFRQDFVSRW